MPFQKPEYIPLLPNEKIRIAFIFQVASYWPSWESFHEACLSDNRFDVKLLYLNRSALEKAPMQSAGIFLSEKKLNFTLFDDFDFDAFHAHVVVLQSPYDVTHRLPEAYSLKFKKAGARLVYIPYGIEISDMEVAHHVHFQSYIAYNSWRIYTLSNEMLMEYREYCPNRYAVRAFGLPKFDYCVRRGDFPYPSEVIEKSAGRKIVLIKVHFPKVEMEGGKLVQATPFTEEYLRFADTIEAMPELFFIFCPHPAFFSDGIGEEQRRQSRELLTRYGEIDNVYVDKSDDYRPSLLNADAIIIDRSALMVEAAISGAPILFMSNPEYAEPLTKPVDALVKTYYQGTNAKDMLSFVEMFRKGKDPNKSKRQAAFEKQVPFTDGKCGERIKNDIADSMQYESQSANSNVKIAIVCVGKVFDYYRQNTKVFSNPRYEIVVMSDNNPAKWGQKIDDIEVVEPARLRDFDFDFAVVVSELYFNELLVQLIDEVRLDPEKIIRFDYFVLKAEE